MPLITPEQLVKSGTEDGHQKALFCWAALNVARYPQLKWMHHIPNGGSRHIAEAGKLKAMGVKSGVADIFLPWPERSRSGERIYAGLYIELKRLSGKASAEQLEFGRDIKAAGYAYFVCYGWEEARDRIVEYLNGN